MMMESSEPKRPEKETEQVAERLVAEANMLRSRGDLQAAAQKCQEALAIDEHNWQVLELLGDLQVQMGEGGRALDEYRKALAANPSRGVIEEKIGRLVLRQAEHQRMMQQAEDLLSGRTRLGKTKNKAVAGVLSLALPGLGQIYNERPIKGIILVCGTVLVAMLFFLALASNLAAQAKAASSTLLPPSQSALGALRILDMFLGAMFQGSALIWLILWFCLMAYSVVDATIDASRQREVVSAPSLPLEVRPKERPEK